MREIELSRTQRYGLSALLALVATLLLFMLMVSLVSVRFKPLEKPKPVSFENFVKITKNTPPTVAEIRRKRNESEHLLDPVSAPPMVRYKGAARAKTRPVNTSPEFSYTGGGPSKRASIIIATPTLPPPISRNNNSINSRNDGSVAQCTIAFTLAADGISVTELQWKDCIGKEISDAAEVALYKWVNTAPDSYTSLNPKAGDILEFTFMRRSQ